MSIRDLKSDTFIFQPNQFFLNTGNPLVGFSAIIDTANASHAGITLWMSIITLNNGSFTVQILESDLSDMSDAVELTPEKHSGNIVGTVFNGPDQTGNDIKFERILSNKRYIRSRIDSPGNTGQRFYTLFSLHSGPM